MGKALAVVVLLFLGACRLPRCGDPVGPNVERARAAELTSASPLFLAQAPAQAPEPRPRIFADAGTGVDAGFVDGGFVDAGTVDAGIAAIDAGVPEEDDDEDEDDVDAGVPDAGVEEVAVDEVVAAPPADPVDTYVPPETRVQRGARRALLEDPELSAQAQDVRLVWRSDGLWLEGEVVSARERSAVQDRIAEALGPNVPIINDLVVRDRGARP
ncbi:MAG: hypothetical protein Q8O67_16835 [Deltaproteobacteria bacterium]|nr:hypothetical protein [Deltaproteobacteria bacterium]